MAIDWSRPLQTREGKPVKLLSREGWQNATGDQRKRGWVCKYLNPRTNAEKETGTTWLYDENGRCNTGGADSPNDLLYAA